MSRTWCHYINNTYEDAEHSTTNTNDTELTQLYELVGATGKHNQANTIQPVYHYIKAVLIKHKLTPLKAKAIINDRKGTMSPNWNKNVIPFIIDYLKEIEPNFNNTETSAIKTTVKVKDKTSEKNYSYKAIAIAYCMMSEYIMPEKALDILTKHSKYKSISTLLNNRIDKQSVLTRTTGNPTSNSKHLNALNDAERLLKGLKKTNEVKALRLIINAFTVNVDKEKIA